MGITEQDRCKVVGLEDSSAGVLSLLLAGFAAVGLEGGNIRKGGSACLCAHISPGLEDALQWIFR